MKIAPPSKKPNPSGKFFNFRADRSDPIKCAMCAKFERVRDEKSMCKSKKCARVASFLGFIIPKPTGLIPDTTYGLLFPGRLRNSSTFFSPCFTFWRCRREICAKNAQRVRGKCAKSARKVREACAKLARRIPYGTGAEELQTDTSKELARTCSKACLFYEPRK